MSHQDRYIEFLRKWLGTNIDALGWIVCYGVYAHAIDDIIDGDKTDSEHILKTFGMAASLFMHEFCRNNFNLLYPLIMMAHNTYRDSVILENAEEEWKHKVADALRQTGNEVILACVQIVNGIEARNEASLELREISYHTHHTEEGEPI
jgi:hypothetical protein